MTTSFTPAVPGGVVTAIVVEVVVPTTALPPPTVTVAPELNPVPVITITVPPAVVPEVGLIDVIVGAGTGTIGGVGETGAT